MSKKVIVFLLIAMLITGTFAGCSSSSSSETSNDAAAQEANAPSAVIPKEVVIGLTGDAYSLDPFPLNETITNAINNHIFNQLVEPDPDLQPEAALAESWDIEGNGKKWIFHLREGVTFQNGNEFNADDVIYSFDRSKEEMSAFKYCLSTVESYQKINDYTVEVTCIEPNALLLAHLKDLSILDAETCSGQTDDWIALNPNGTGRYQLVEHVREDRVVLERNENYWGELPEAEKVTFKPITNESTRTANMISGAVNLVVDVPVRDIDMLKSKENLSVVSQPSLRIIYLNLAGWSDTPSVDAEMPLVSPDGSNPLKDIRVREAMYRAINEEEIVAQIMNGFALPATTYIPEGFNGYNPDVKRLDYNKEMAEQMLDDAGYPRQADGYRFEITLDASNDRYINDAAIASAVAGYFEKVGIKVNLNLMSRTVFFKYISASNSEGDNTHVCMTGWADSGGESALMALDLLYSKTQEGAVKEGYGGVNRGFYVNPDVDVIIDQAMMTVDPEERASTIQEAWKIAADDVSYIPLHFQQDIYAYDDSIIYHPRKDKYVYAWDVEFVK